jgi:hypothetical protein
MDDETRELVRNRAGHRCEYCRIPQRFFAQLFQIEHIVARSHGGNDTMENLALACRRCNLHKGPNLSGVDPESGATVRLFHPRNDNWDDHFIGAANGIVQGISPIGGATARVLAMNTERRIELRRITHMLDG